MHFFADVGAFNALFQVIVIDLVLAGDNAVVIGMAAAGLPHGLRRKAIIMGIGAATLLRIGFAFIAVQILAFTGLLLAGGILLLWVCWKMWQETRIHHETMKAQQLLAAGGAVDPLRKKRPDKTLKQAVTQIIVADVSMSLDNVLAVAGAAQQHLEAMIFGLALSVALMGFASAFIARLLERHRWIAYLGLGLILVVAVRMVYHGLDDVMGGAVPDIPHF